MHSLNKISKDGFTADQRFFLAYAGVWGQNITCYDRNGKIVKNVSSKDSNDVEDTEGDGKENGGTTGGTAGGSTGDHAGGNTGDTTGGNTGESTGGGSQTGGTGSEDGNEHIVL